MRADGATYNFRAFLGMIGFEWRRADNFARKFVKERHRHEPDGTHAHMPFHKGQAPRAGSGRGLASWGSTTRGPVCSHRKRALTTLIVYRAELQ